MLEDDYPAPTLSDPLPRGRSNVGVGEGGLGSQRACMIQELGSKLTGRGLSRNGVSVRSTQNLEEWGS